MVRVITFTQKTLQAKPLVSPPTPREHSLHLSVPSLDTSFRSLTNCALLAARAQRLCQHLLGM